MTSFASSSPWSEGRGSLVPHGRLSRPGPDPTKNLEIKAARRSTTLLLAVVGSFDYDTKDDFLEAAARQLDPTGSPVTDVRLDFAALTHCDSSALSALIAFHRRTTAAGIQLHLDRPPVFLQRMLTLTGLGDHLTSGPPGGERHSGRTAVK
jgi:anti-anti-sigma factor